MHPSKVVAMLLSLAVCMPLNVAVAQESKEVPEWLEFVEEVRVPVDISGSQWFDMAANAGGDIAFISISASGMKPWLFSSQTQTVKRLDPEQCRPGTKSPLREVEWTPDGELFVAGGPEFFWFGKDGKCLDYRIDKHPVADFVIPLAGRGLLFAYKKPDGTQLIMLGKNGEVTRDVKRSDLSMPRRSYRQSGGGFVNLGSSFLLSTTASDQIAAYNGSFDLLWKKQYRLDELHFAEADFSTQEAHNQVDAILASKNVGYVAKFFGLAAGHALVVCANPAQGPKRVLLIDVNGNLLAEGSLEGFVEGGGAGGLYVSSGKALDYFRVFHVYRPKH